jgi:hypothetical protein
MRVHREISFLDHQCRDILILLERSTSHSALDLYAPEVTQRIYEHLVQQAARVIQAGFTASAR